MSSAIVSKPFQAAALDELVATYAPIGVRCKRRQQLRRSIIAAGSAVAIAISIILNVSDVSLLDHLSSASPQRVAGMSDAEAEQLAAERAEFNNKLSRLEAQIVGAHTQKQDLEAQLAEFEAQSLRLEALLADMDSEQSTLDSSQQQGSQLDHEIAAMAAQRKNLEKRWAQFEAQGELLAMEIIAINAQRKELESQRELIQMQRQQLADMLREADALYRRNVRAAGAEATQDASTRAKEDDDGSFIHTSNSLTVNNAELDDLRGGFRIGDGMDIAFGFTQIGTINGVEQFSNSFSIDSVASGFEDVDMSNMNSVLIQNGSGNFVSGSVLDSLSDSFSNIIQNTLDDQVISTTTTFDISLQNMPGALQGLAGEMALIDTLGSF